MEKTESNKTIPLEVTKGLFDFLNKLDSSYHFKNSAASTFFRMAKILEEDIVEKREEREHIGYIEREEGFYKLYSPPKNSIVTQAFIMCKYCDGSIYHCMGPKYDAVCFSCYEKDPESR